MKIPYIEKGNQGGIDFYHNAKDNSRIFLYVYFFCIIIFFFVLLLRLFQLTVVKGAYYSKRSEQNRIREILIEPKRGTITDRKGFILAENREPDVYAPGTRITSSRVYYDAEPFAHVIGYRGMAGDSDFSKDSCDNKLKLGDKIGKKGVEKLYDCELRGKSGKKLIEVDAKGRMVKALSVLNQQQGQTLQLAIDKDLQKVAYELIKGHRAVVVGLKPHTGEVLVLASAPSFDSQAFENIDNAALTKYFSDESKPMFNRATEGTYPPGSTFKITMATAALEEKKIDEATLIEDTGTLKAGTRDFGNWYYLEHGKKEGMVDIVKALQRSNDIFFYQIGGKLGPINIKSWSEKFGFGRKTGLGIDEVAGTIPSPFWKEDILKEKWYTGDTYNMSIGQGYILTTPLQVAQMTNIMASDGYLCEPILRKVSGDTKPDCKKLPISEKTLQTIKKGMVAACTPGGTAWPMFNFKVSEATGSAQMQTACKTGTAESHGEETKPHAWFTIYAPAENPEITLTVMFEEEGQGSDVAAPVARDVLKAYFNRKQ